MSATDVRAHGSLPFVDILVPVYDEAEMIQGKLQNLRQLAYPADLLRIIVIDGGSQDGTADLAREWMGRYTGVQIELVSTTVVGKPGQLNEGLRHARGEWVMVTDADARLPPNALLSMVQAAQADTGVSVVGAEVRPAAGHPLDRAHWAAANFLLRLESRFGSAGLVVGPCYMVRRECFDPLPAGTVADDVRVSCRALLRGARIACAKETVLELRTPVRGREFFRHKVRKARGYLHEVRASLPLVGSAAPCALAIFAWRAALLLLPPVFMVASAVVVAALGGWDRALAGGGIALATAAVFLKSRPGRAGSEPGWLTSCVGLPLVTAAVLLTAICARPFCALSPRYSRIRLAEPAREV